MLKKLRPALSLLVLILALGLAIRYFYDSFTAGGNKSFSTTPLFAAQMIDVDIKPQKLSQYKGKIIVLNFWATWCAPCREEMPELSQLYQTYRNKNVVVVGIAFDELYLVKEFLQSSPVSYPVLVADMADTALSDQLGNDKSVLPYTVIIDTNGKVIKTYPGRVSKALLEPVISPLLQ